MTYFLYHDDISSEVNFGDVIAIDTETMGLNINRDRLCLIQLSNGDGNAHLVQISQKSLEKKNNFTHIFFVDSFDFSKTETWEVDDALHAGPVLMHEGKIRVTSDEEVFFGSTISNIHPRTAAGYRNSGELVLLVVDGRQIDSRGVDLQELAILMRDLGCVEAINLDGGGSSAMVVDGKLLNRPAGTTSQREVMSAIAVSVNN